MEAAKMRANDIMREEKRIVNSLAMREKGHGLVKMGVSVPAGEGQPVSHPTEYGLQQDSLLCFLRSADTLSPYPQVICDYTVLRLP